jgi:hypothetical protein
MNAMKTGIVYTIIGFSDIIHHPAFIKKLKTGLCLSPQVKA